VLIVKESNIGLADGFKSKRKKMRLISLLLTAIAVIATFSASAQENGATKEFQVDTNASWLRVLAYPDGALRRFGHHHVIAHREISGVIAVAPNPLASTVFLELGVEDFEVDNPVLRKLEGEDFKGEISTKDIDGTRANMLGEKLLNVAQFPVIQIRSIGVEGSMPDLDIIATVTLIGMEYTVKFPANVQLADDSFLATGRLEITHGELGLSPFTAAGGALSVRDLIVLKYEISGALVIGSE